MTFLAGILLGIGGGFIIFCIGMGMMLAATDNFQEWSYRKRESPGPDHSAAWLCVTLAIGCSLWIVLAYKILHF
jgi:hypothetical protein